MAVCLAASPVLPFTLAGAVVAPILATAGAIYACVMLPLALAGGVGAAAQLLWLCRDGAAVAVLLMCRWAVGRAVPSLRGTASVLFVGLSGHLGLLPASAALFLYACAVLTGVSSLDAAMSGESSGISDAAACCVSVCVCVGYQ